MSLRHDLTIRFLVSSGAFLTLLMLLVATPNFSAAAEAEGSDSASEEPTPEPEDTWAVVDPATGNVLNVIVCTESMCGRDGVTGGTLEDGVTGIVGNLVRQGSQSQGGWRSGGGHQVTWQEEQGSFLVESSNGNDSSSSMRVVPREGKDFVYRDIGTTNRFSSGDESATVSTNRSDFENPTLRVDIDFPGLGQTGSLLTYWMENRNPDGDAGRRALDQIGLDVDSILIEEGFAVEEIYVNEDTGERSTTRTLDSSNSFVVSIREITAAVVGFLGSLLGLD